ncbi:ABC transporter F family member 3 [Porphyridium purpureum]|uniref:Probable ATP-dependent transporter ycf16 n=1 Tax=Porphyridium purpureum TaxID=35688 RepID=A0A5J4YTW5_PORPP|nr:ABC transporter F family member 3 [Porphyridium purpureum]|eukprot:POR0375..scf229_5
MAVVSRPAARARVTEAVGAQNVAEVDDEVVDFLACVLAEGTSLEHEIVDTAWQFLQQIQPGLSEEAARQMALDVRRSFHPVAEDAAGPGAGGGDDFQLHRLAAPKRMGGSLGAAGRRLGLDAEADGDSAGGSKSAASKRKEVAQGNANATLDRSLEAAEAREMAKFRKARRTGKDTKRIMENLATVSAVRSKVAAGAVDVRAEGVDISFGGLTLLEGASLSFAYGRRYGIVGRNGIGKSTLMKAIARRELPLPEDMDVLFVEQEVVGDATTPLECVLDADEQRARLLDEEAELTEALGDQATDEAPTSGASERVVLENRLKEVYAQLEMTGADTATARAAAILSGLGFTEQMQQKPSSSFSGGWRMRIAIARALFVEPRLLLLDEPTNHLDLHTVLWLSDYLQQWPHTIVTVSHDRDFLNEVCTDIIYVKDKKLHPYAGNYDDFEKARSDQLKEMARSAESFEMRRKHVQSFVDRFRFNAKRAAMAQSRIKLLQKMEENRVIMPTDEEEFMFNFPEPGVLTGSHASLVLQNVSFGWPIFQHHKPAEQDTGNGTPDGAAAKPPQGQRTPTMKLLFDGIDFSINTDSRAALVGPNGAGKSTILKLLLEEIEPIKGEVKKSSKLRLGYFSQHHIDQLVLWRTPLEHMKVLFPESAMPELRSHLARLGVSADMAMRPINTLSGGQKSRVALAAITMTNPHILLLDEPTNHLDIETIDALIEALNAFSGGVLVVSHDSRLLSMVCDELFIVKDGAVTSFPDDFRAYRKMLVQEMRTSHPPVVFRK